MVESSLRKQPVSLRDVWPRGTSASQWQKFHTDDVKLSGIWLVALIGRSSSCIVFAIAKLLTAYKTGQLKVNCKRNESTSKQSNRTQNLNHNQPEETKNWTNLHLEPHDFRIYANIELRRQYGIEEARMSLQAEVP